MDVPMGLEYLNTAELPASPLDAAWVRASWGDRISVTLAPNDIAEHNQAKLAGAGPCWLFHGWSNGKGHAKVWIDGRGVYLHRYSFEQFHGVSLIPSLVLDHLCRRRNCFNPLHLESVSPLENYLRGDGPNWQFKPAADEHDNSNDNGLSDDDLAALARGW